MTFWEMHLFIFLQILGDLNITFTSVHSATACQQTNSFSALLMFEQEDFRHSSDVVFIFELQGCC